jgi:hypothetical protein
VPLTVALLILAFSAQTEPVTLPPDPIAFQSTELAEAGAQALSHPASPE